METEILEKVNNLRDALKEDELVIKTKELEKKMLDDDAVIPLIVAFQKAQDELNDAIKYKLELGKYQKVLSEAKEKLYSNSIVKEYLESLKKTNEYLDSICKDIFNDHIRGLKWEL